MKKNLAFFFSIFLLSIIFSNTVMAKSSDVDLLLFYGEGCPHCASAHSYLDDLSTENPSLNVLEYEIYSNQENRVLLGKLASAFETEISGVPTMFIKNQVISGFGPSSVSSIEDTLDYCLKNECLSPLEKINSTNSNSSVSSKTLTISAVLSAAIIDAINPCAFAVLIILLTTILGVKNRKRALLSGLAFSASIYISYFLMGLGLYSAIQAADFARSFYITVSILAIIIGLLNLKDYFWYGKWFVMEVPLAWRPRMKSLIRGITSPIGAFMIGFLISLFLLPCTSGPYIVILGLLSSTTEFGYALSLLALYNFVFILPMLIITLSIFFGFTTADKAEEWRKKRIKVLHLVAGIIILLLGIGMLTSIFLGYL